jgi:DNA (cytosine-5)-methyltransferase 1
MSVGASWAGVRVLTAIEADGNAAHSYRLNHAKVKVLQCTLESVREFSRPKVTEPLIVFGGPPCQGFSVSNQRTRDKHNPKNWLFRHYLRFVRLVEPDWVVFENVSGIAQTENGLFLERVQSGLKRLGYDSVTWVLNASDFGVPQRRTRLFIVGNRSGVRILDPKYAGLPSTVGDAICDLPPLSNGANVDRLPYRSSPRSTYARQMRGALKSSTNHLVTNNAPLI